MKPGPSNVPKTLRTAPPKKIATVKIKSRTSEVRRFLISLPN
jgi:hypothetical protein